MRNLLHASIGVCCLASVVAAPLHARQDSGRQGDATGSPLARPAVVGAAFSADAVTTVRQTLRDGTRMDRTATARYYRDSAGRVRIEQAIDAADGQARVLILVAPDPTGGMVYAVEPATGTFYLQPRDTAATLFNGLNTYALPVAANRFLIFHPQDWRTGRFERPVAYSFNAQPLRSRRIGGVDAEGRRASC